MGLAAPPRTKIAMLFTADNGNQGLYGTITYVTKIK